MSACSFFYFDTKYLIYYNFFNLKRKKTTLLLFNSNDSTFINQKSNLKNVVTGLLILIVDFTSLLYYSTISLFRKHYQKEKK